MLRRDSVCVTHHTFHSLNTFHKERKITNRPSKRLIREIAAACNFCKQSKIWHDLQLYTEIQHAIRQFDADKKRNVTQKEQQTN